MINQKTVRKLEQELEVAIAGTSDQNAWLAE